MKLAIVIANNELRVADLFIPVSEYLKSHSRPGHVGRDGVRHAALSKHSRCVIPLNPTR
jgi:hypothetical protein